MRAILLSLMLLWSSNAYGQFVNVKADCQECTPLGCRVFNQLGSSVCIGVDSAGRAIHLTAGHCITGARHVWSGVNGEWKSVTVLGTTGGTGTNWSPDVAIYATPGVKVKNAALLADRPPVPGDDVVLHSYRHGDGKQYRARAAKVLSINEQYMELSVPSENGDSGGAVVYRGKLVGIISATGLRTTTATGLRTTTATTLGQIRSFVQRTLGGIPDCGKPATPAPETPPMTEADPAPLPNVPPTQTIDVQVLVDQINGLRLEIKALRERKLPDIPVELYDETTGALVDRRLVPLGEAIQLGNRKQKVK